MNERPTIKLSNAAKSFGSGAKSVFNAIGEAVIAAADASAERSAQIQLLEVQMRDLDRQITELGGKSRMNNGHNIWSPTRQGHLFTCPAQCQVRHCPTCGNQARVSTPFCWDHS